MLHWDKEMKRLGVKKSLKELPTQALFAYCAAAFEHGVDVVADHPSWGDHDAALAAIREGLDVAWQIASSDEAAVERAQELADKLDELLPGEDEASAKGQFDLLTGLGELLASAPKLSASAALDCTSYAYQAITDVALGVVSGGEADFRKAEQGSEACLSAIERHAALAEGLARVDDGDFSRTAVMNML